MCRHSNIFPLIRLSTEVVEAFAQPLNVASTFKRSWVYVAPLTHFAIRFFFLPFYNLKIHISYFFKRRK